MTVQSKFSMAVFAMRIAHKLINSLQNESLSSFEFFRNLGDFRWKFREFSIVSQNRRV